MDPLSNVTIDCPKAERLFCEEPTTTTATTTTTTTLTTTTNVSSEGSPSVWDAIKEEMKHPRTFISTGIGVLAIVIVAFAVIRRARRRKRHNPGMIFHSCCTAFPVYLDLLFVLILVTPHAFDPLCLFI